MSEPLNLFPSLPIDPFTQTYIAIRTGLLAYKWLGEPRDGQQALLTDGNFLDGTDPAFGNFQSNLSEDTTPDMVMIQGAKQIRPFGQNSLVSSYVQRYILIATQARLSLLPVNQLTWLVGIALRGLGPDLGLPFVEDWNITTSEDDAFGKSEWKRGQQRYLTVFNIDVKMYQDYKYLLNL